MPAAVYDGGMGQRRLLIVDDEESVRSALRNALEADGYSIAEAADGATALTLLQSEPCEVVISDHMMPGLSGDKLAKMLRANPRLGLLGIVLVSSCSPEQLAQVAESVRADAVVRKSEIRHKLLPMMMRVRASFSRDRSGRRVS